MGGDVENLTDRVGSLRRALDRYRERYGDLDEFKPLERLSTSIASRRARLQQLNGTAAEIAAEIKAVETEITGIEKGIEALIGEVLPDIREKFREAWSPMPVLGYRLWAWSDGEMHGVRTHWTTADLTATCETDRGGGEIPHSDGRCGRLGCGIYAAKNVKLLLKEFAPALRSSFAVGLIELSGKVIEHERGYRGAHASVVALVAVDQMRAEFTTDINRLERLFRGAQLEAEAATYLSRADLMEAIVSYLIDIERKRDPWT